MPSKPNKLVESFTKYYTEEYDSDSYREWKTWKTSDLLLKGTMLEGQMDNLNLFLNNKDAYFVVCQLKKTDESFSDNSPIIIIDEDQSIYFLASNVSEFIAISAYGLDELVYLLRKPKIIVDIKKKQAQLEKLSKLENKQSSDYFFKKYGIKTVKDPIKIMLDAKEKYKLLPKK